jgi:polyisoprenyl-phosphate glycosyltransferase
MLTDKKISAVVVCYRDEGNIRALYERLAKSLTDITPNWEIIYVNDASPDKSGEILKDLAAKDPRLTVIMHSRNFGAQSAFTNGMIQALGDAVVIMDGDLQDPPELIAEFVKKWLEGYEVVYGVRRKREKSMGKIFELLYHMFYVVWDKMAYVKVPRDAGEFSLMDRKVVEYVNALPERDRLIRGLRAWVGFSQIGVDYVRPERFSGESVSSASIFSSLKWAKKAIFSFSYRPLEWVFSLAMLVSCSTVFMILWQFFGYFIFRNVPQGLTTVILIILFLGGVQLLSLAVIGEYVGRIFEEIKARPRYITKEILNDHRKK